MAMSVEVSGAAASSDQRRLPIWRSVQRRGDHGSQAGGGSRLRLKCVRNGWSRKCAVAARSRCWMKKPPETCGVDIRDVMPFASQRAKPLWRVSVAPSAGHQLVAALRLKDRGRRLLRLAGRAGLVADGSRAGRPDLSGSISRRSAAVTPRWCAPMPPRARRCRYSSRSRWLSTLCRGASRINSTRAAFSIPGGMTATTVIGCNRRRFSF